MFTLRAETLAAILDQAAPHRFPVGDDAHDHDVLVLDSTPGYLHAVACSDRALAVARTAVAGDVWTAPIAYEDAAALRGWLESSDTVTVEHVTADGHHQLRFTEGSAQITVPAASYVSRPPWRSLLRIVLGARDGVSAYGRPVQLSADDLSRWLKAGERGEAIEFRSLGPIGTLVTAGPDFLGLQVPHTGDGPVPGEGWSPSLRTRRFLFAGRLLEVGARYADLTGTVWTVPARPGAGEEPYLVSADAEVLPISQVLATGKFLIRLPD
ncbi:hypothetical protein OHT57_16490 [Streptomyces sp. NBC_00285]|uniref:hypothetical protein n=1 Tax=Streptomyces sp. NBC_00285 TaxID=2975700 RepID=UPI002E29DABA|nr:hypothetical protein [Streptomyces sp. NBC_00285]